MAEITNKKNTIASEMEETVSNISKEEATTPDDKENASNHEIIGITSEAADKESSTEAEKSAEIDSKNRQDFEKLKTLPYLDLFGEYRTAQKNVNDLKSAKEMMDQVGDLDQMDISKSVEKMNVMEKAGFDTTAVKDFYAHYQENLEEGERIIDLIARMLLVYDRDMLGSTAFISKSAMEAADRRLAMVDTSNPNAAIAIKRITITRDAYANRVDYSVLLHKLRYPANIVKIYNEFRKDPEKAMKYVDGVFMKVFNDQHMSRFRAEFKQLCFNGADKNVDETAQSMVDVYIFFITYWLASVYEKEYESGKCAYVKNLVMNVYDADPSSNIYDLAGGVSYLASVCFTIYSMISIITSGNFTAKDIHNEINTIMDTIVEKLLAAYQDMIIDFPGRTVTLNTSFESITDNMSYDDLPEVTADTNPVENVAVEEAATSDPAPDTEDAE